MSKFQNGGLWAFPPVQIHWSLEWEVVCENWF